MTDDRDIRLVLPDRAEPARHENLPEEERLREALRACIDAASDVLAAHGPDCDCGLCYDAEALRRTVELYYGIIDCQLFVSPADVPELVCVGS